MFDMFKGLGQFAGLARQLPKLREEMDKMHQRLAQISAEGDAGGGMVKVRVSGHLEVLGVKLGDAALELNDPEMLEDLIKAATNQALQKARQLVAEETGKMASGLGIPSGAGLPGLG